MTREETKSVLSIIMRAYPRFKIVDTKEDVDLWHECLEDLEYARARTAAINIVKRTKDFPPDIATIREEYDRLLAEEKHEQGEIKRFYEQARSYYPGCGEYGYGWKEFSERAKTKEEAENLQNLIIGYVNYIDRETDAECIDFAECVKRVTRHPCEGIYIAKLPLKQPCGEAKR